jgi:hypothetical protein
MRFSDEKSHFLVGKLLTVQSVFLENVFPQESNQGPNHEEGNGPWLRR